MPNSTPPKKSKTFGWIIGGAALAFSIVLGAFFVNAAENSANETGTAVPALSAGMGQPIVIGEASATNTVTIFEDFQCPFCKALEGYYSNALNDAVAAGKSKIEYFPVAFLTDGSAIASNAAACAADQGKFAEYHQALFAHQPDEGSGTQFNEDLILSLGKSSLMPDEGKFEKCVKSNRYGTWVKSMLQVMDERKITGTPAFFINGKSFDYNKATEQDIAIALGLVEPAPAQPSNK